MLGLVDRWRWKILADSLLTIRRPALTMSPHGPLTVPRRRDQTQLRPRAPGTGENRRVPANHVTTPLTAVDLGARIPAPLTSPTLETE